MTELVTMHRAAGEVAVVRPEWVADWEKEGWRVAFDDAPEPVDLTREGIAAMDKPEVLDLLDAHGWDGDRRLGVGRLREALIAIMFVEDSE